MIDESGLQLRRQILDWRDKHYINIYRYLSAELAFLFESIDEVLDEFTISDTFKSEAFFKTRIEPIYDQWVQQESDKLLNDAEQELNQIIQHVIERDNDPTILQYQNDTATEGDAVTAGLSTVAGLIATAFTASSATVSAGGLAGFIMGATVISWPVVLVGGSVALGLSYLGIGKSMNIMDAKKQLRKSTQETIRKRVIYNKEKDAVCQLLQNRIFGVSNTLIRELVK
jgi:hypothetical protein